MSQVSSLSSQEHERTVGTTERVAALFVSTLLVGVMWVLAWSKGAVGISRADDWSYLLTQFEFGQSGEFLLNNWAVTMLIGQTIAAWPVTAVMGANIFWHQVFVATFAVAGLWITYLLLRRYLAPRWSTLSVGTLALGPLFAPSAISFMTDVPAFAFMAGALLAGAIAVDRSPFSWPWFAFSLALSLVAFTFRDYAILAGLTVALVAAARVGSDRSRLMGIGGGFAVCVGIAGGLYLWRHALPNDLKLPGWPLDYSFALLGRASLTGALVISPALAVLSVRAVLTQSRQQPWLLGAGVFGWVALVAVSGLQFLGNVVHPFGTSWLVTGPGIRMWPLGVNRILIGISAVFLLLLILLLVAVISRWWGAADTSRGRLVAARAWVRDQPGLAVVVGFPAVLFLAHVFATLILGTWWIDRYFILWIPFASAGVIAISAKYGWSVTSSAPRRLGGRRLVAVGWVGVFVVMSFHVVDFDALVDGTKWIEAEKVAIRERLDVSQVDGGMPFVAFHETSIGLGAQDVPAREGRPWWIERYPERDFCWTVGFAPSQSDVPAGAVDTRQFRSALGAGGFVYSLPGPDDCAGTS